MLRVLYFSDRSVQTKLLAAVDQARRPTLVTGVRDGPHMRPVEQRALFVALQKAFGDAMDLVVVADDGTAEGMWRDPMGALGDRLFPDDRRRSNAVATGYSLVERGRLLATWPKRGTQAEQQRLLLDQLGKALGRRAKEGPATSSTQEKPPPQGGRRRAPEPETRARRSQATEASPWELLGIERTATLVEAKRAFRARVAQYHPDKVAHLAPEFQELAERRTRELLAAWEVVRTHHRTPEEAPRRYAKGVDGDE